MRSSRWVSCPIRFWIAITQFRIYESPSSHYCTQLRPRPRLLLLCCRSVVRNDQQNQHLLCNYSGMQTLAIMFRPYPARFTLIISYETVLIVMAIVSYPLFRDPKRKRHAKREVLSKGENGEVGKANRWLLCTRGVRVATRNAKLH